MGKLAILPNFLAKIITHSGTEKGRRFVNN